MTTTVLRIRQGAKRHHRGERGYGIKGMAPAPGDTVRVYLPPEAPNEHWICDTRWVWRVVTEDVERLAGGKPANGGVYVCEHQVEAD